MEPFLNYYDNLNREQRDYFEILGGIPDFIIPYIETNELYRLKDISYFCGMDYCSKKMYNFKYYVSRLDHSISASIMTYYFSKDKMLTIKALLHDIATPSFFHVVDYMNDDYIYQETTENGYQEIISRNHFLELFSYDKIDFKQLLSKSKNDIVDNETPKLCVDRLDGLFLNNLVWSRELSLEEIKKIYNNVIVVDGQENDSELGFQDKVIAKRVNDLSIKIGQMQLAKEDMFPMLLMADILKYLIVKEYISYNNLYNMSEREIIDVIEYYQNDDLNLYGMYQAFTCLEVVNSVPNIKVKKRYIDPLVNNRRITKIDEESYKRTTAYLNEGE